MALRSDLSRGRPAEPAQTRDALAAFGGKVLGQLPATGNASISPYSIYAVLAMARAGAKGETARQLDAILGGDTAGQGRVLTAADAAIAKAVSDSAAGADADPAVTDTRRIRFSGGNSVWIQPEFPVRRDYLDALARGFGVGVYQLDFAADPERARQRINDWVRTQTDGLIRELLVKGVIDDRTVMALVNAVHLSAPWAKEFNKLAAPATFSTLDGEKIPVPMMTTTQIMAHAAGSGWTSVSVPYRGNGLAMTLIVPDAGSFAAVRGALPSVVSAATSSRATTGVRVSMPGFTVDTHLSLSSALKTLGVRNLFALTADLSGIAGRPGWLYAKDLVHQSVVGVDEKGTEAAAATAAIMEPTSGIPDEVQLTVDRPFFFVVHDTTTGAPLFLGQVTDPAR